jgi:hypothetical protein
MGDLQFNGPPLDQGGDLKGILTRQGPVPLASLHSFHGFKDVSPFPHDWSRNDNVGRCFYGLVTLESVQNLTVQSGRFSSLG